MANVRKSRDPVEEWEFRVAAQFEALRAWSESLGILLTPKGLPRRRFGAPGQEHEIFHRPGDPRLWKVTFPNQTGFGPSGFFTPLGYLRRLRISNHIFGDDVEFEGILTRPEGLSIVTSQSYVLPHPGRSIPTEEEIAEFLTSLRFAVSEDSGDWERSDGVRLRDTHDRNFIRAADESIIAIDVQPELQAGFDADQILSYEIARRETTTNDQKTS